MDHPWTTGIESLIDVGALLADARYREGASPSPTGLNQRMAEGVGFEPTVRVNGRRFSRPPLSYN